MQRIYHLLFRFNFLSWLKEQNGLQSYKGKIMTHCLKLFGKIYTKSNVLLTNNCMSINISNFTIIWLMQPIYIYFSALTFLAGASGDVI
jgi:hypothetical protein